MDDDAAAALGKDSRAHPIIDHTASRERADISQLSELVIGSMDFDAVSVNFSSLFTKFQQDLCQPLFRRFRHQSDVTIDVVSQVSESEVQTIFSEQRMPGHEF